MKETAAQALKAVQLVKSDAHAVSTINGTGFDKTGFGELLVTLEIGDKGAAGTAQVVMEHSDVVGSGYVAITGGASAVKAANGVYVGRVDLEKTKKFVRANLVVAGNAVDASVHGTLIPNKDLPVTQTNAVEFSV